MNKLAISIYERIRRQAPYLPLKRAWREAEEAAALIEGVARPFKLEVQRRREAELVRRSLIRQGLAQSRARRDPRRERVIASRYR